MTNGPDQDFANLGFGSALGFSPSDLVSPAVAASDGFALPDRALIHPPATELRVHGVSGSNGPIMLEHPEVIQVAGDSSTMFYRRWNPAGARGVAVKWKLEAYSWGGLTEKPLAAASWILLAPFMLFNVAHFALPVEDKREPVSVKGDSAAKYLPRSRTRRAAQALLRLLGFTATVEFTLVLVATLVNTLAFQAGSAHLPSWLKWYAVLPVANRVRLAVLALVVALGVLWWISVKTASKYESRTTLTRPQVKGSWAMTETGFWQGAELVRRQRNLHAAGALAAVAFILSRPSRQMSGAQLAVTITSSAVLVAVMATLFLKLAERYSVSLQDAPNRQSLGKDEPVKRRNVALRWCQGLLLSGAIILACASFLGGWTDPGTAPATVHGLTNFTAVTLAVQALLVIVFAVFVAVLYRRTRNRQRQVRVPEHGKARRAADLTWPYFRGQAATLLVALAVCTGATLSGIAALFVTRIFGSPVPSGPVLHNVPGNALQVPWPLYALAAAPLGLVAGAIAGGVWVVRVVWRDRNAFLKATDDPTMSVDRYYEFQASDGGTMGGAKARKAIALAWARGRAVDQVAVVVACMTAGMAAAIIFAVVAAALESHRPLPHALQGLGSLESLIGLFVAGLLVGLLRSAYSDQSKRKTIGALWDVGTFWPRASHPFAPPCYAERAVPELVDRIRILTGTVRDQPDEQATDPAWAQIEAHRIDVLGRTNATVPTGRLLLTGYSQGAVIAPAVVAQLPPETLPRVSLLTLACPARRLYGRAFPEYFGPRAIGELHNMLQTDPDPMPGRTRWRNVVRKTDYIGSWIFRDPEPAFTRQQLEGEVDQACPDPVLIAEDADQTPPPIHAHSAFFQDPFVTPVAQYLIYDEQLASAPTDQTGSVAGIPADDQTSDLSDADREFRR